MCRMCHVPANHDMMTHVHLLVLHCHAPQGVQAEGTAPGLGSTMILGTYGYMAPEQFRGQAQAASDAYAVGATLLFLLTGWCTLAGFRG